MLNRDDAYYGEVTVHFRSGGAPLLLSITRGEMRGLHSQMQNKSNFHTFTTIAANQMVTLRIAAIADLYLSDDAVDTYGPEHEDGTYDGPGVVGLEDGDWALLEHYEGAEPEDVEKELPKPTSASRRRPRTPK